MFVRKIGSTGWVQVEQLPSYQLESELEKLLAESPELLPGRPSDIALVQQLHIPRVNGMLDLCGVTPEGALYLIECKLAGNPDMRRTIVGQLLAYAAGLTGSTAEDFLTGFAQAARNSGSTKTSPQSVFDARIDAERTSDEEPERFVERLGENLRAGRFTLVFAVDRLTEELGLIVDYLQEQMATVNVCALELRYSRFDSTEIIVPSLRGAQMLAAKASSGMPPATGPDDFAAALALLPSHVQQAFQHMQQAAQDAGAEVWGARKSQPTLGATYQVDGRPVHAWLMSARPGRPGFGLMWRWMRGTVPDDRLKELYEAVRHLPGAAIWDGVDRKWNYVNYLDADLAFRDPGAAATLTEALHRALGLDGRTQ